MQKLKLNRLQQWIHTG